MRWLSKVRLRRDVIKTLNYEMDIVNARIRACETDLVRISDMRKRAYKITWSHMLDHYQNLCALQNALEGCGIFWTLTGYRLSFKCLWLTTKRLARTMKRRNAV